MSVDLEVEDVCVSLGGADVLDHISLDVNAGEFVTLLGHSGSGKTTTLNVVAGFIRQTSGHVRFAGSCVDAAPPAERDIGIVFQNYALFPHMSVLENVAFPLQVRGVDRRERLRRAEEYLELVQLDGMGKRRASTLSGGQQQRVALARALVFNPRLLLLDEPLAALDKQLRETMQVELKRIQREVGVTTISVTHDQIEALSMSDRVGIMSDGRLGQYASPEDVYSRPQTEFIARFVGEANLVPIGTDGVVAALGLRLPHVHGGGTAVVRPEHLELSAAEPGPGEAVLGRIEELSYQGSRRRVLVRLDGANTQLIVSSPSLPGSERVERGARVAIACDPRAVHVIPAGAESAGSHPSTPFSKELAGA
jgi:putative spermidine/putrescine transport system ATP-binding protein